MKRLTVREVATRAGVSVGTVSNALNQTELVAPETLQRVLDAVEEIGFVRNNAARQLRGARSPAIGLVILDIDNPFFTEMARGVEDAATESGHLMILCSSAGQASREDRHLRLLEEQRVAGILITPVAKHPSALFRDVKRRGTPTVLLDRMTTRRDQCCAAVDDVRGGGIAADHLVELGHTKVALINGPGTIPQCIDRRTGFLANLARGGMSLSTTYDVETDAMTIAEGKAATLRLLERRDRPTAIFCTNDMLAIGAEHAAITHGLRVPEDIAIIGYDDVQFASMSFVPLTSVRQPAHALGYRAAKLLLDEASGADHKHQHIVFEPELVVRESTVSGAGRTGSIVGAGPS